MPTVNTRDTVDVERSTGQMENGLAERLTSALFQIDRAQTEHDLGAAHEALSRIVQETDRVGVPLAAVSRMSGLSAAELRRMLE